MPHVREFCRKHYSSVKGNWDLYKLDLDEVYLVDSSIDNVPKSRKNNL